MTIKGGVDRSTKMSDRRNSRYGVPFSLDHCDQNVTGMCPLQSIRVTINSDDPAYFGGYINANYASVQRAFSLDRTALAQYAVNSVKASFASAERKNTLLNEIREVTSQFRLG